MNKILKNVDITLFFICIFIITCMSLYAKSSSSQNIQTVESNIDIQSSTNIKKDIKLYNPNSGFYNLEERILWILAEIFVIGFILWCIFFYYTRVSKKNNHCTEEIQNNLTHYISKLERTNKEIIELKEELNQQHELLYKSQKKIENNEKRYNSVLANASISIFEWDITENIVTISGWIKDILGLKNDSISSKEFLELMPEEYRERHVNALYEYIERKKGNFHVEEKYMLKDGTYEWFEINAIGIFSNEGLMVKICGSIENINEKKLSNEKIKELEYTDYLTGLPNKLAFYEKLEISLNNRNPKDKIFVFLVDIDDLGIVNNEVGSGIGDEVIKVVANRIVGAVSQGNYVARIGGDEFVILTFNINNFDEAHKKALRIIKEFEKPFIINDDKYYITASMGIVIAPEDGLEPDFLIKNATEAMYKAKEVGKNTYSFYTESINQELIKKLDMSNAIKIGIEKNEFFLNYQPQYDINTGKIIGFESLVRWKHPERGIIYPIEFMPVAEESGLIVAVGEKILMKACKQARDWWDNGFSDIIVSINLSIRQFNDKNFYNLVQSISNSIKLKPQQINFEICDNIILQDTTNAISTINKITPLGFTFSIHNVSNNLLSIVSIQDLPIKFIKLERNFITTQLQTEIGCDIIKILTKKAHTMNYNVIAEGIETESQIEFFKENNCNIAQGYYFSKPITDTQVDELLAREFLI